MAWDILEGFLGAKFSQAERHRRRLAKVAAVELERASQKASA
jgi:ribose 5-phosphate isomerase RpiB